MSLTLILLFPILVIRIVKETGGTEVRQLAISEFLKKVLSTLLRTPYNHRSPNIKSVIEEVLDLSDQLN